MRHAEADLVRSALSSLGCVEGPSGTYHEIKAHEDRHGLIHVGRIEGRVLYMPRSVTRAMLAGAAAMLTHSGGDNGKTRLALYELWLTTRHERMDPADRDAMLMVYTRRLAAYPPEHVEFAIRESAETSAFFPSWKELAERLEALSPDRRALKRVFRLIHDRLPDRA